MGRKLVTGQRPFTMLTPGLTGGSDPSRGVGGNPVKIRESYQIQMFPEVAGRGNDRNDLNPSTPGLTTRQGNATFTTADTQVACTATFTVATAVWPQAASWVQLGEYRLVAGADFVVANGDVNTTATNLATAINNLPGFVAAGPAAATITVTGPAGPEGNGIVLKAGGFNANWLELGAAGSGINLDTTFVSGEPYIGPPSIS